MRALLIVLSHVVRNYSLTLFCFRLAAPVEKCQKDIPLYAEHFPQWSEHTSGIAQAFTWVAFNEAGLGANLQVRPVLPLLLNFAI